MRLYLMKIDKKVVEYVEGFTGGGGGGKPLERGGASDRKKCKNRRLYNQRPVPPMYNELGGHEQKVEGAF